MRLPPQQAQALSPIMAEEEDFLHMSDPEFESMRHPGGKNYTDVYVLQHLLGSLDREYKEALREK